MYASVLRLGAVGFSFLASTPAWCITLCPHAYNSLRYRSRANTSESAEAIYYLLDDKMSMEQTAQPIPELGEFIIANKEKLRNTGQEAEMNRLLTAIKLAAKVVNREINKAGLADILGAAGCQNVQGEEQQKLDVFANHKFIQALVNREVVCGICTEEDDDFLEVNKDTHFVMLMDPLDASPCSDATGTVRSLRQGLKLPPMLTLLLLRVLAVAPRAALATQALLPLPVLLLVRVLFLGRVDTV
eukprot:XP_028348866.1 uncharacterized protein LOC114486715 [Physeter catodon]